MHKIIVSLLVLLLSSAAFAQNRASIKGILIDSISRLPLEFATIAVINARDTALISYTLSDKKGIFNLTGLPIERSNRLIISYVGYKTFRQNLNLQKGEIKDFGPIILSGQSLNEVVIQGARSPVVIRKDTIEFNTEAFKTRPNAVVEELLTKLPGVQINTDGSILVNGKSISKLLIDGKQFFGNDPTIATKNLDADMVDKVQVYDDRENDPDHKLSDDEVSKVINLKLKSKVKKSLLGKVYAGAGTRDRYEAGGILSSFRDTLQVSLIGISNNLNRTGFNDQELNNMGGFDRSNGDQAYNGTFGSRNVNGIEKVASTGFNINNDYGTKLKMNLSYFYTRKDTKSNSSTLQDQILATTRLLSASEINTDNISNKHVIGGLIAWTPDTLNKFRYEPKLSLTDENYEALSSENTSNTLMPRLTESKGSNLRNLNDNSFYHNFFWYRRLKKKGESINIRHTLNLNKNGSDIYNYNALTSYTTDLQSEVLDRLGNENKNVNSADFSATYNYPISKKFAGELNAGIAYTSSENHLVTYDKNNGTGLYDLFLPNQSTELDRNVLAYNIKPMLEYKFTDKLKIKAGINVALQNVKNQFSKNVDDVNHQYFNLLPWARLTGRGLGITYNERIALPEIYQMQPITREYSQLYRVTGNPGLKPKHIYELTGNFYKYNRGKQTDINAYGGITLTENNILIKRTIDPNGAANYTYINKNGNISGYFSGSFGKQFKKSQNWKTGLNTSAYANFERSAFFLNTDEGIQYNYTIRATESINLNYKELLSLNGSYSFSKNITTYKEVDYSSINTYTHNMSGDFSLRWPKKIIIDGKYGFNYNPQVAQGFPKTSNIVNLAVSVLMQKKDRGQLKLSVYDLLDENISVRRYAYGNSITTSDQNVLKRYLSLTYLYKLNITTRK